MASWTEGRVKAFITSVLRAGARKWPPRYTTLHNAKVGKQVNERTGRVAEHYRCNVCEGKFPAKEVEVDHKEPVIDPRKGFISWDVYIERLFCPEENLQVLCKPCHLKKTKYEKSMVLPKKKGKE